MGGLVDLRYMRRERTVEGTLTMAQWLALYQEAKHMKPVQIATPTYAPYCFAWMNRGATPKCGFREYSLWGWLPPKPAGTYKMEWIFRPYWSDPVASWKWRAMWDLGGVQVAGPSGVSKARESPLWRTWDYRKMIKISLFDWWPGPPAGWVTDGIPHGVQILAPLQVRYTY